MSLGTQETWRELFDFLQVMLQKGITRQEEVAARTVTLEWLTQHGIKTFQHYEREHAIPPVGFTYGPDSPQAVQITVYADYNGEPVTLIAGSPPRHTVQQISPVNDSADVHWPVQ